MTGHRDAARLSIEDVSVDIAGRRIIDQVAFSAQSNMVGLVGPNGSGKSTLLRTVYRMLRPAAGRVVADGHDVWTIPARQAARVTAALVQDSPADLELTVADCVATGRLPHGRLLMGDPADDSRIVRRAMAAAGVTEFADRDVSTLSGGERQRVQLARALAQQPQILVLDEPTNHLDIHHQLQLLALVRTLSVTTLVTLHDLNLAAAYCDQVAMLEHGRVVAFGPPAEVFTPHRLRRVFAVHASTLTNPLTGRLQLAYADDEAATAESDRKRQGKDL
ncbi:ABC transporter ATP-binding protein [Amycolatopsis sp. PS_44_ISF1]|uniref:ABC transporter ATP-binding protein n=1 Tax=Amycolatopsis sp. PS_44_ISF1 TaxID=2974917 RepID=UPI0028DF1EEA|nr:ABC transporter ATP-binding protein [Amycolatopsis sp. PS_44_ISF1]MDT8914660.1 ABC transporter ATP-binding protein [Amycolatopsis sp. PS_44_ISF1]